MSDLHRIVLLTALFSLLSFHMLYAGRPEASVTMKNYEDALELYNEHSFDKADSLFRRVVADSYNIEELTETRLKSIQYLGFISRERNDYIQSNKWFRAATVVLNEFGNDEQKRRWRKVITNEIEANRSVIDYYKEREAAIGRHRKQQNTIMGILLFLAAMTISTFVVLFIYLRKAYKHLASNSKSWANTPAHSPAAVPESSVNPIRRKIVDYIVGTKAYLNPDLCLDDVCRAIGSNRTYVSSEINAMAGNFNSFINENRVKESIRLLSENSKIDIEEVWELSGFNSKTTFYSAFKDYTGMTPSIYRKASKDISE